MTAEDVDPTLDPRVARDQYLADRPPSAGLRYLRSMAADEARWLLDMTAAVARQHSVDHSDLLAKVMDELSRDHAIEPGRSGLRTWLRQKARWRAKDLARKKGSGRKRDSAVVIETSVDPTEPSSVLDNQPQAAPAGFGDLSALLRPELGLTRTEAQVIGLLCWGFDLNSKDVSELLEVSESKARKSKERGRQKLRKLFTADEIVALVRYRQTGSVAGAAEALGLPNEIVSERVGSALTKVAQILDSSEGRADDLG